MNKIDESNDGQFSVNETKCPLFELSTPYCLLLSFTCNI